AVRAVGRAGRGARAARRDGGAPRDAQPACRAAAPAFAAGRDHRDDPRRRGADRRGGPQDRADVKTSRLDIMRRRLGIDPAAPTYARSAGARRGRIAPTRFPARTWEGSSPLTNPTTTSAAASVPTSHGSRYLQQ